MHGTDARDRRADCFRYLAECGEGELAVQAVEKAEELYLVTSALELHDRLCLSISVCLSVCMSVCLSVQRAIEQSDQLPPCHPICLGAALGLAVRSLVCRARVRHVNPTADLSLALLLVRYTHGGDMFVAATQILYEEILANPKQCAEVATTSSKRVHRQTLPPTFKSTSRFSSTHVWCELCVIVRAVC